MAEFQTRPVAPEDWSDLHRMATHWPVVRQMGSWPWPTSEAFTRSRSGPYRGRGFVWAIVREGRTVGTVAVTGDELGYMLHPDAQGQGIMRRAVAQALAAAFDDPERTRVVASVWWDNPASASLLERAGFEHWQTAYVRGAVRYPTPTRFFRLSRARWQRLSAAAQ